MSTFDKVKDIIVENLGCGEDEVTLEANLVEDLNADSLSVVEMTMAMEDEFGCTISDEELPTIKTVGDLVQYIEANT